MSSAKPEHEHREDEEAAGADDEYTGAQVAPIVKLEEVAVTTGEDDEDAILDLKDKLYRFDKEGNQWKERGASTVKLLKHKETGKVCLVMHQSKTLKICANHQATFIFPLRYNDGDPLSIDEQSYIIDTILNYHPDKAIKMEDGLDYIMCI